MNSQECQFYEFGPFRLDARERLLLRDEMPVPLTLKAFEILLLLVESSGHVVSKEEFIQRLWPDTFVEEGILTVNISIIRKALGDTKSKRRYIETVPRRGYRFVASVSRVLRQGLDLRRRQSLMAPATAETEEVDGRGEVRYALGQSWFVTDTAAQNRDGQGATPSIIPFPARHSQAACSPSKDGEARLVRSLAVLPFKYLGVDENDKYLGLGMADALITKLSNIRSLIVRPTSAVVNYDDPAQDAAAAGRELKVEAVFDGRIQRSTDSVRMTVQLVNVRDGVTLWADKFDEKYTDIFALQDSISERVAAALTHDLTREERLSLRKRFTSSGEAYQAYIKGRYYWNRRTAEGLKKGIEWFRKALIEDPNFALAHAGLADSFIVLGNLVYLPPKEAFSMAKMEAVKALEIDDTLAEAHTSLGYVNWSFDWDWPESERQYLLAIELNGSYATAHHWYALYLASMERFPEALREVKRALELDPVSLIIGSAVSWVYFLAGLYDEAIEQCRSMMELDPKFYLTRFYLSWAYERKGMGEEAIAEAQSAVRFSGRNLMMLTWLGCAYALLAKRHEAEKMLSELRGLSGEKYVPAIYIAVIYSCLDQKSETIEWLEKAYDERSNWLTQLRTDPKLDNVRSDPRFEDLMRRVGLAP